MERDFVAQLIGKFNQAGVRYLIAGGFAVNAHGYVRYTNDLDLILWMEQGNALKAVAILKEEGYAPKIPVPIEQFADAELRRDWIENRNMVAFPLYSDKHQSTGIDLFVTEPLNFNDAFERRRRDKLGEIDADFVGIDDLIQLKREASRSKDLLDIKYLEAIRDRK